MDPLVLRHDQRPQDLVVEQQQLVEQLDAQVQKAVATIAALKQVQQHYVASAAQLPLKERAFQEVLAELEARNKELQEAADGLDDDEDIQTKFTQFSKEFQVAWTLFQQLKDADALSKQAVLVQAQQRKKSELRLQVEQMKLLMEAEEAELARQEALLEKAEHDSGRLDKHAKNAAQAVIDSRGWESDSEV
jgi:regulator of replication initiation timing